MSEVNPDTIVRLDKLLSEATDPDWFQCLVMTSLEETKDLDKAIDMAEQLIKDNPNPPDEEDFAEYEQEG